MLKLHVFSFVISVSKFKFVPLLCAKKKLEEFNFEVFLVFCVTADLICESLLFCKVSVNSAAPFTDFCFSVFAKTKGIRL